MTTSAMAEHDLVGGVGDRLVRRRARAAHACTPARPSAASAAARPRARCSARSPTARPFRRRSPRRARRRDSVRWISSATTALAELDRAEMLEHRAGARERRAHAGDDRDAAAAAEGWHTGNAIRHRARKGRAGGEACRSVAMRSPLESTGADRQWRRSRSGARAARRSFDLLVIGGGITGCGIARDAALRGLSRRARREGRLRERHVEPVVAAGARRRALPRARAPAPRVRVERRAAASAALAPHLVRPLQFTWPVYEGARIPRWKLGAGLTLYDALALFRNVGRHRRLTRASVLEREPMLRADGLRGGARTSTRRRTTRGSRSPTRRRAPSRRGRASITPP